MKPFVTFSQWIIVIYMMHTLLGYDVGVSLKTSFLKFSCKVFVLHDVSKKVSS